MTDIWIVVPTRAEAGALQSVRDALPEAGTITWCPIGTPAQAHACALQYYTEIFTHALPKLVLLLGDRYETHAAALAAHFLRIPIAHIHGGETTTGAFDDALRHGIMHMATLHFVATEDAARRVSLMTRGPRGLEIVGAPGLDTIVQNSPKRDQKLIVVSYYPETMAKDYGLASCRAMLAALEWYATDHAIFFSRVNADPGSVEIQEAINEFMFAHPQACAWISPNTREQYLHLLEHAAVVVGNSSSGVIECPWIGVPSVNVGLRQNGRPMANTIFQSAHGSVVETEAAIASAMVFAKNPEPIYRGGGAPRIAKIVREFLSCA